MPVIACVQGGLREVLSAFRSQDCMHRRDPWHPHTVLVPSERTGRWLLQALAGEGGALNLEPMTIRRFAELLLPELPAVSPVALKRLRIEEAIATSAVAMPPGPGLPDALESLWEEIAAAGIGPGELPPDDLGITRVLLRYADLSREDRPGEALLPTAAWAVRSGGVRLPDHLDMVGFTGLSPLEAILIEALRDVLPLSLFLPASALSVPVSPAGRRLREVLDLSAAAPVPLPPVHALPAPHGAAEADLAGRLILQQVAGGTPPARIAVFGGKPRLLRLEARLQAASIPVDAPLQGFLDTPFGAAVRRFSLLLLQDRSEDLLELLSGPGSDPWAAPALREALESLPGRSASGRLTAFHRLPETPAIADAKSMAALLQNVLASSRCGETWTERSAAFLEGAVRLLVLPGTTPREMEVLQAIRARLAGLDGSGIPCSPDRFERALAAELAAARAPVSEQPVPGVRLLHWGEPLVLPADLLIGLGLAEDEFPPPSPSSPLLPDRIRQTCDGRLATFPMRRARLLEEAAAALGGARRIAAVFTSESRLVAKRLFAPLAVGDGTGWPDPLPALDPLSLWSREGRGIDTTAAARSLLQMDDSPTLSAFAAWHASTWTEYDGQLPDALLPPGKPEIWSPSQLETYGACGYRYLVAHLLRVEEPPDADELDLDPVTRGQLAHVLLDRIRQQLGRRIPGPADLPFLKQVLAEETQAALADLPPRPLAPVGLMALEADLFHFLAGTLSEETLHSEWTFGRHGGVAIHLPRGDLLRYRGRIDWIGWSTDAAGNRCLAVVDYKTGRPPDGRVAPHNLQIALYMLAVSQSLGEPLARLEGRYVSVTAKGEYRVVRIPGDAVQPAEVARIVEDSVAGIEAGRFHPNADADCTFCPYQGFCPRSAALHKEREGAIAHA